MGGTLGLTSGELASVLATVRRVKALATVGNSLTLRMPSVHDGGDAALAARDSKARKSEAVVAAVDNFDLSGLSEAASRIEHAIS